MIKPTHTYIGRCRTCHRVLSSTYDMEEMPKETSKHVAAMIACGLEVEHVPLGSVEIATDGCSCRRDQTATLPLFALEPAR